MIHSLIFGFTLPLRSLKMLLGHPKLAMMSLLPVLVTLGIYFWIGQGVFGLIGSGITALSVWVGLDPTGWVSVGLAWGLKFLSLLLFGLSFAIVASIVASPFNDFLAEAVEPHTTPPLPLVHASGWTWRTRLVVIDLMKSGASILIVLLSFLISFIPLLNLLAAGVGFLVTTFQYVSYPQTRRGLGLREGARFLGRYPLACLSFGMISTLLFSIPFVGAFYLPLAVTGGTLLFARAQDPQQKLR